MKILSPGMEDAASGTAITIGSYDGVHLGHQELFRALRRRAEMESLVTTVVTFNPHPARIVEGATPSLSLTTLAQKLELIESCGIDQTMVVPFDQARAQESAEDFVKNVLVRDLDARFVVVGENFHFGRSRTGNVKVLTELGQAHGFEVMATPLHASDGEPISSSRIRRLIAHGNVENAALLLGRAHCVMSLGVRSTSASNSDAVISVAMSTDVAVPTAGLYFGNVSLERGSHHDALLHVTDDNGLEQRVDVRPLGTAFDIQASLGRSIAVSFSRTLTMPDAKGGTELTTRELTKYVERARALGHALAPR